MFGIVFVYHLVRMLKDLFIQYNANLWIGAKPEETSSLISALKFWYVLPGAILTVIIFTALLNRFGPNKAFYITVVLFMSFYFAFAYFMYPNLDKLLVSEENITAITLTIPTFFRAFVTCICNWPLSLFYIISELWGTMAISFLFWQFANRVTMPHEVKRFFGLFSLIANLGTILAGETIKKYSSNLDITHVRFLLTSVVVTGGVIIGIYAYITKIVIKDPMQYDESKMVSKDKPKKQKLSAVEGIKILVKNPYLMLITIIILCYGIAINFSEILMYASMKEIFSRAEFASIYGTLSVFIGVFATIITLCSNNILRKFPWKIGALITPLSCLFAGGIFLSSILYKQFISTTIFGFSAGMVSVYCGVVYDALVKGVKYSLFDTTKSMAYIPMDEDEKIKGQAAAEIIGGRAGKAGASIVQQIMISFPRTLVTVTGSVSGLLAYSPAIISAFFATVIIWIIAVLKLSVRYEKKLNEKNIQS